eukprot:3931679-Rhodomonas_salina.1
MFWRTRGGRQPFGPLSTLDGRGGIKTSTSAVCALEATSDHASWSCRMPPTTILRSDICAPKPSRRNVRIESPALETIHRSLGARSTGVEDSDLCTFEHDAKTPIP